MSRDVRSRADAIQQILQTHGTDAVYVASTGYVSRAVAAEVSAAHVVFYMQGSMGLAPALGLGMALASDKTIVFKMNLRGITIEGKFEPKKMTCRGRLEL